MGPPSGSTAGAAGGTDWLPLLLVLAIAFALRAYVAVAFPSIDHPDEIYQATEQAHRLIFGYGVTPWEFRVGARSWLLPGLLAGILAPIADIWPTPRAYLPGLAIAVGALSLLSVWAAYDIGRRFSRTHGLAAAFAVAIWIELAYYGVRPLTGAVATNFLLLAIALLSGAKMPTRVFWGGVALGGAFAMRFHLAPGLAIVAVVGGGRDWRGGWLPMLAGAALPIAVLGIVDTVSWGMPFGSILTNLRLNILHGRADIYGTMPATWYLDSLSARWGFILLIMAPLIGVGAARKPLLLAVAAVIIASHSLIAHKEYRFIVPAIACLIVLAGFGLAECANLIRQRWSNLRGASLVLPGACLLFGVASYAVAHSAEGQKHLTAGRNVIEAFLALSEDPDLCGLALADDSWFLTPGYSALHRRVPIYLWASLVDAGKRDAVSAIVRQEDGPAPDAAFSDKTCFQRRGSVFAPVCIYRRHGGCQPAPGLDLNAELIRTDQ